MYPRRKRSKSTRMPCCGMHDAVTCGREGAGGWHAFSVARMPVCVCRGAHADLTRATVFVSENKNSIMSSSSVGNCHASGPCHETDSSEAHVLYYRLVTRNNFGSTGVARQRAHAQWPFCSMCSYGSSYAWPSPMPCRGRVVGSVGSELMMPMLTLMASMVAPDQASMHGTRPT